MKNTMTLKNKMLTSCITATSLLVSSASAFGPNQEQFFPPEASGMISINDFSSVYNELNKTLLVERMEPLKEQLMAEEEIIQGLQILKNHEEALGYSLDPASLATVIDGIDIYEVPGDAPGDAGGFVVLEYKNAETAEKTFKHLTGPAWEDDSETKVLDEITFEGHKLVPVEVTSEVSTLPIKETNYLSLEGSNLLISNSEKGIKSGLLSDGFSGFAASSGLADIQQKIDVSDSQVFFYLNTSNSDALTLVTDQMDFPSQTDGGKTFMAANIKDGTISSRYYYKPDDLDGLKSQIYKIEEAGTNPILSQIGDNSLIAVGTNALQTDIFIEEWDRIKNDPNDENNQTLSMMEMQVQMQNGLSFRDDILPAFGPNVVLNVSAGASPIPTILMTVSVKDAEKAKVIMDKIEQNLLVAANDQAKAFNPSAPDVQVKTADYNGTEIRTVNVNAQILNVPFSHAMTSSGYYTFGVGANVVQDSIDNINNDVNQLANDPLYQKMLADGAADFNYFNVVDLEGIALLLSQALPMAGSMIGLQQQDMLRFGQAFKLVQSMGKMTNTVDYDGEGLRGATYIQMPLK